MQAKLKAIGFFFLVCFFVGCGDGLPDFVSTGTSDEVEIQVRLASGVQAREDIRAQFSSELTSFQLVVYNSANQVRTTSGVVDRNDTAIQRFSRRSHLVRVLGLNSSGEIIGYFDFIFRNGDASTVIVPGFRPTTSPPPPDFGGAINRTLPPYFLFVESPPQVAAGEDFSVAAQVYYADGVPAQESFNDVILTSNGLALDSAPPALDTDSNGRVEFTGLRYPVPSMGVTSLNIGVAGVTGESPSIVVVSEAGSATFLVQPSNVNAGEVISPPIQVEVRDSNGQLATTGNVTIALGDNPGGSTLGGTTQKATVNGVATFDDLSLDNEGQGYTLVATADNMGSITSDAFDVNAASQPLVNWRVTQESRFSYDVGFGNNTYVTVGSAGLVRTSSDGLNWTTQNSGVREQLNGVRFVGGQFIAVGRSGVILTSPDGVTWTRQNSGVTDDLFGVAENGGRFVVTGESGLILSSTDAIAWSEETSNASEDLYAIVFANGLFVAGGCSGELVTSPDGLTWTSRNSMTGQEIHGIAFGAGLFVAVTDGADIVSSPDGTTWTLRTSNAPGGLESVVFDGTQFVAVGSSGNNSVVTTSSNGTAWTLQTTTIDGSVNGVTFGNSLLVAAGFTINTSTDGTSWTERVGRPSYLATIYDAIFAGNQFVIVGFEGGLAGAILTSPDGMNWTSQTVTSSFFGGVTFGNGTYVACSNPTGIFTSPDGVTWTFQAGGPTGINDVHFANGLFVGVGLNDVIATSTDGIAWSTQSVGIANHQSVTFANGTWIVTGLGRGGGTLGGNIFTSTDGTTWAQRASGLARTVRAAGFGNGTYVAVGEGGTIYTSSDAVTWTPQPSVGSSISLEEVIFQDGSFVVVGSEGTIITSTDGVNWTSQDSTTGVGFRTIVFVNGTYYAFGDQSIVVSP